MYRYGMRLRGFAPMCQPMDGLVECVKGVGRYWNVLHYSRKLEDREVVGFDLDYLGYVDDSLMDVAE